MSNSQTHRQSQPAPRALYLQSAQALPRGHYQPDTARKRKPGPSRSVLTVGTGPAKGPLSTGHCKKEKPFVAHLWPLLERERGSHDSGSLTSQQSPSMTFRIRNARSQAKNPLLTSLLVAHSSFIFPSPDAFQASSTGPPMRPRPYRQYGMDVQPAQKDHPWLR